MNFVLGAPVIYTKRLSRQATYAVPPGKEFKHKHRCKRWEAFPCMPGEGVIVGRRTLSNGYIESGHYDEPNEWIPQEYFRAYMVADNIDQKPFFVLPEHLEEWSYGRLELLTSET